MFTEDLFAQATNAMESMGNSYNFLETASLKQYLVEHSIEDAYENIKKCIHTQDLGQLTIMMNILDEEWRKADQNPE